MANVPLYKGGRQAFNTERLGDGAFNYTLQELLADNC